MGFIDDIQTSTNPLLVKFIIKRGGDVRDADIKHHLLTNKIHP